MKQLLLATNNQAKIDEIRHFFSHPGLSLVTLQDVGVVASAPEDGKTFEENAIGKAKFYMELTHLPALADDGGIEIDALGGEPGVASHRWISRDADNADEDLIAYTLERMKDVQPNKRGAQMHLVLAFSLPNGQVYTTEGIVRGVIADKPASHRTPGFPFRSVFFLPKIGKYYDKSELTQQENEAYNHRREALEKMKPIIHQWLIG